MWKPKHPLLLAALAVSLAGCASAPGARQGAQTPDLPREIHWVRNSAEYRALFEQTFRLAGEILARRVEGREPESWAIVIDADETLIGNSRESMEQALATEELPFEERWDRWVERREAPALPGARVFLERVRELGGRIAVVTNRRQLHCPQTADNLRLQELPFDVILCRDASRDKAPRWEQVRTGSASPDLPPLDIVMWVGDNILDFPGLDQDLRFDGTAGAFAEFGDRFFLLPNPLYGSWEENPPR